MRSSHLALGATLLALTLGTGTAMADSPLSVVGQVVAAVPAQALPAVDLPALSGQPPSGGQPQNQPQDGTSADGGDGGNAGGGDGGNASTGNVQILNGNAISLGGSAKGGET